MSRITDTAIGRVRDALSDLETEIGRLEAEDEIFKLKEHISGCQRKERERNEREN